MNYYRYLNQNKDMIAERLQRIFEKYRLEAPNHSYDKLIVMKSKLADAFGEISELGIVIKWVSLQSDMSEERTSNAGSLNGMGVHSARFSSDCFGESPNEWYLVDEHTIERLIFKYDRKTVQRINKDTLAGVYEKLAQSYIHTPIDFAEEHNSVTATLWLIVPKDWQKNMDS